MNLRLHPRSVAPAEGHEKCGPRRPTRSGYSCNNAVSRWREPRRIPLDSEAWRADLAAFQNEMAELAAAEREAGVPAEDTVAFEGASIDDDVTIRAAGRVNVRETTGFRVY